MSAPEALKEWLKANGAKFDKVAWPSTATVSGERGAVATGDIGTNEVIMSIPANLLMAPPAARASALGEILENDNSKDGKLLRGDMDGAARVYVWVCVRVHARARAWVREGVLCCACAHVRARACVFRSGLGLGVEGDRARPDATPASLSTRPLLPGKTCSRVPRLREYPTLEMAS